MYFLKWWLIYVEEAHVLVQAALLHQLTRPFKKSKLKEATIQFSQFDEQKETHMNSSIPPKVFILV